MSNCLIATPIAGATCADKKMMVGGANRRIFVINRDDIASYSEQTVPNGTFKSIVLKASKKGVQLVGRRAANAGAVEMTNENGRKRFNHTVTFVASTIDSPGTRAALEELAYADGVVVVVEKNSRTFEVYGANTGLEVTALSGGTGTAASDANEFTVTLGAGDGGGEPGLPVILLDTDYATTLAALITATT